MTMPSKFFLALQTNSPPQTPVSLPSLLTHLRMWEDSRKCLQHQPPRKMQAIFKNHCSDHLKQDCYSSPVAFFIGGQEALDPIKPHRESGGHGNESAITLSLPSWKKSCHPGGKTLWEGGGPETASSGENGQACQQSSRVQFLCRPHPGRHRACERTSTGDSTSSTPLEL